MPSCPITTTGACLRCPVVSKQKEEPPGKLCGAAMYVIIGLLLYPSYELKTGKCSKFHLSTVAQASGTFFDFEGKTLFTLIVQDFSLPFPIRNKSWLYQILPVTWRNPVQPAINQEVLLDPSASRGCLSQVVKPYQDNHKPSQFWSGNSSLKYWCWLYAFTPSSNMLTHSILQKPFTSLFPPSIILRNTCFLGCEGMAVVRQRSMSALGNSGFCFQIAIGPTQKWNQSSTSFDTGKNPLCQNVFAQKLWKNCTIKPESPATQM